MGKTLLRRARLFVAILFCSIPLLAQKRFDIAMEGPWIFYQENNLKLTDGNTYSALIAVAPKVPGHYDLVFTSGNGLTIPTGLYCVAFNQAAGTQTCTPSAQTSMSIGGDSYVQQQFVPIQKGSWDWKLLSTATAYVVIIPLPSSWSSDGQYDYSFMSTFPANTGVTLPPPRHSTIGVQLHYDNFPPIATFALSSCSIQTSGVTCSPYRSQANSGTLRISIKSPEELPNPIECDQHVHRAHHYMTSLIDLGSNPQFAYLFDQMTFVEECQRCDPQQQNIPSDCSAGAHPTMTPAVADLVVGLGGVISQLQPLQSPDSKCQYAVCDLQQLKAELASPAANLATLSSIERSLQQSENALLVALEDDATKQGSERKANANESSRSLQIKLALSTERFFMPAVVQVKSAATSGKDCRAAEMLVR